MIAEGIEKLREMAVAAYGVLRLQVDANDHRIRYWDAKNSKVVEIAVQPSPRRHGATTIASFVSAFKAYSDLAGGAVWVSLDKIVGVFNDGGDDFGHRDETITMPILVSPLFETLEQISETNDQKSLVQLIRHDLKPSAIKPDGFELAISNLKWESQSSSEGNFGVLASSVGREIRGQVKGERDIPPEVSFTFEPFPALADELSGREVTVDCSVLVDALEQSITITPYPGQLDMAKAVAVEALRHKIAMDIGDLESLKTFAGQP